MKTSIKIFAGCALSVVFIYFAVQGANFQQVLDKFANLRPLYLIAAVALTVAVQLFRSLRWSMILSPLDNITQRKLFPVTCIGFMAIVLFPLRLGELVKPYLVSRKSEVTMTSAFATVFVERVFDLTTLICIVVILFVTMETPDWMVKTCYGLVITLGCLGVFIFLMFKKNSCALSVVRYFSNKAPGLQAKLSDFITYFKQGFGILNMPRKIVYVFGYSCGIWGLSGLIIYCLFLALNMDLVFVSALFLLVVLMAGISIPTAPGFLGNFQAACTFALSFFGVGKSDALAFSLAYYGASLVIIILLGLLFVPFEEISFKTIRNIRKNGIRTES